jgi:hypothetical protein
MNGSILGPGMSSNVFSLPESWAMAAAVDAGRKRCAQWKLVITFGRRKDAETGERGATGEAFRARCPTRLDPVSLIAKTEKNLSNEEQDISLCRYNNFIWTKFENQPFKKQDKFRKKTEPRDLN